MYLKQARDFQSKDLESVYETKSASVYFDREYLKNRHKNKFEFDNVPKLVQQRSLEFP